MAYIPSQSDIEYMFGLAGEGNLDALEWLQDYNKTLSKRANSRMDYMRKSDGYGGTGAMKQAEYDLEKLGRDRFSESKRMSLEDMQKQMEASSSFLRSQTSSIRGEKLRRENIYRSLEEKGYIDPPDDPDEERRFKSQFNDFLSSDAFADIKKVFGSGIIAEASEQIQNGLNVQDLVSLYNEYTSSADHDIFQVWDGWLEGKTDL